MRCDSCVRWKTAEKTIYGDGSIVVNQQAPEGKGHCLQLDIDTAPEFGCTSFAEGDAHEIVHRKEGAPWQHSHAGPCPDCTGNGNAGDGACHRCAGTGKVRHYDDGYVGEERTRLHPREREHAAKPKCAKCGREVDVDWKVCPTCGNKLDAETTTEVVEDPLYPRPLPIFDTRNKQGD